MRESPKNLLLPESAESDIRKICLPTFADKVTFWSVRATSAIDLPMLSFTGVNRMAWMSPSCGPLCTIAIPEICPRSLILLAMVT